MVSVAQGGPDGRVAGVPMLGGADVLLRRWRDETAACGGYPPAVSFIPAPSGSAVSGLPLRAPCPRVRCREEVTPQA